MGNHNKQSVFPALVLMSKTLTDKQKLLIALIENLSNERGYCFSSNKYMGECLNCSERYVQQMISDLENKKIIGRVIKLNEKKEVEFRAIMTTFENLDPPEPQFTPPRTTVHHNIYTSLDSKLNSNTLRTHAREENPEKESNIFYRSFNHLSITNDEVKKLEVLGYSISQVDEVIDDIENFKGNHKYKSLYLTAKKWLKKVKPENEKKQLGIDDEYSRDNFFNFN